MKKKKKINLFVTYQNSSNYNDEVHWRLAREVIK